MRTRCCSGRRSCPCRYWRTRSAGAPRGPRCAPPPPPPHSARRRGRKGSSKTLKLMRLDDALHHETRAGRTRAAPGQGDGSATDVSVVGGIAISTAECAEGRAGDPVTHLAGWSFQPGKPAESSQAAALCLPLDAAQESSSAASGSDSYRALYWLPLVTGYAQRGISGRLALCRSFLPKRPLTLSHCRLTRRPSKDCAFQDFDCRKNLRLAASQPRQYDQIV